MSTRLVLSRALPVLVMVGIMVGAGFTLYRIGYAHGVQDGLQMELGRGFDPGFPRGLERNFWFWGTRFGFSPLRAVPALVFALAILGLIVVASFSLGKRMRPGRKDCEGPSEETEAVTISTG